MSNELTHTVSFVDDRHRENFCELLERFKSSWSKDNAPAYLAEPYEGYRGIQGEYVAASYIVSLPDIYDNLDWDDNSKKQDWSSPISWYFGEWIVTDVENDEGYHKKSKLFSSLAPIERELMLCAVGFYGKNGHYFDLEKYPGQSEEKKQVARNVYHQMLRLGQDPSMLKRIDM